MKAVFSRVLIVCLLCTLAMGCDDVSKEPRAERNSVLFDATGGTESVGITCGLPDPWTFHALYLLAYRNDRYGRYQTEILIPKDKITIEKPDKSRTRIHYDWITFEIPEDGRKVVITTDENRTNEPRSVTFRGYGFMIGFRIKVTQSCKKEAH